MTFIVDRILEDKPQDLSLVHQYEGEPEPGILIEELFNTDFSRCYLALYKLCSCEPNKVWSALYPQIERAKKDYGALYFFINLFKNIDGWDHSLFKEIRLILLSALGDNWPAFMKFKPSAILTILKFDSDYTISNLSQWLNQDITPFWASRYAALMTLQKIDHPKYKLEQLIEDSGVKNDDSRYVRAKVFDLIEGS